MSDRDLFLAYGALMAGALVPIYHGSFASLPPSKAPKSKAIKDSADASDSDVDDDEDQEGLHTETLTSEEAWMFPVLGSAVLLSMYLVFKYVDKKYVDLVLGAYFGVVGGLAVWKTFGAIAKGVLGKAIWNNFTSYKLRVNRSAGASKQGSNVKTRSQSKKDKEGEEIFVGRLSILQLPLLALSGIIVGLYLWTRHWALSNILALSLSHNAISLMALDSFRTGSIMLGGLFLYDIFWVFGTDVMVSVARGFDGPIKIVWPKNFVQGVWEIASGGPQPKWQLTMLGLGDIVIPGIFIALALRFDLQQHRVQNPTSRTRTHFARPYFVACLTAYILGLSTTMGVMHFFQAAQPALLYLSPACVGAILGTSLVKGEFSKVWNWTDESDEEREKRQKEEKKEKEK